MGPCVHCAYRPYSLREDEECREGGRVGEGGRVRPCLRPLSHRIIRKETCLQNK